MVYFEDDNSARRKYPVPAGMESCHIIEMGDYTTEGHIPFPAIDKLLAEQPDIDSLVMPGMPPGSPGMDGVQAEPFVVYAIKDGKISEFITIDES